MDDVMVMSPCLVVQAQRGFEGLVYSCLQMATSTC